MRTRTWKALPLACALLLSAAGTEAATFTVNTSNDTSDADLGDGIAADVNGKCSLRAAIMQANYTNGIGTSNTIIIPAGVYTLTRPGNDDSCVIGDLDIAQSMTIQGAGSGLTIIDGNGAVTGDRVFQILSSATETTLSGMTIRNGMKVAGVFDSGGGLYWDGGGPSHLRLSDMVFENNAAHYGGGLYLNYGAYNDAVALSNVVVRANTATTAAGGGLGVACQGAAEFDMRNSQVCSNTAFEGGGISLQSSQLTVGFASLRIETTGIYSNTATHDAGFDNHGGDTNVPVILLNCQVRGNVAGFTAGGIGNYGTMIMGATTLDANMAGSDGAGLYNIGGRVTITNSTISSNISSNGGGAGIYNGNVLANQGGMVNLTNATISGNSAATGSGGGIFNSSGSMNLLNCTVTANRAPGGSGGGVTNTSGATITARATIIANNTASSGPDFAGFLTSPQYDFFGNTSGLTYSGIPFASQFNVNPRLGPLQDNGGPTFTHALLPGSSAIDAGRSIGLTVDQRGAPRPIDDPAIPNASPGDGSDMGAFELARPQLAIQSTANGAVLSWPAYYGGFTVQAATDIVLSNAWATVAGAPVVSGNRYVFTNSPITGNKFFQLKTQ
jgi:CSLREA domain-containing protein